MKLSVKTMQRLIEVHDDLDEDVSPTTLAYMEKMNQKRKMALETERLSEVLFLNSFWASKSPHSSRKQQEIK